MTSIHARGKWYIHDTTAIFETGYEYLGILKFRVYKPKVENTIQTHIYTLRELLRSGVLTGCQCPPEEYKSILKIVLCPHHWTVV